MIPIANGYVKRKGYRKIIIEFDDETFADVRRMAIRDRTSFAEAIRTLVAWGLEEGEGI